MPADAPPWNDEQPWENDRTMELFISSPMVDDQNDLVDQEALETVMPWYAKHGVFTWYHSDLVIGEPIGWRMRDGAPEIKVGIFDSKSSGIPYHDQAWEIMRRYGTRGRASIRGLPTKKVKVCIEDRCFQKIKELGLWAVGWVGEIPANPGATMNYISTAKSKGASYWLHQAMHSPDPEIRELTEGIVLEGYAKQMEQAGEHTPEIPEISLKRTEKMGEALMKGLAMEQLLPRCPKCRDYLAAMEKAGVPTEIAVEALRGEIDRFRQELISKKYASFDECVADNQDKEDPAAFCAWLKREHPGACKSEPLEPDTLDVLLAGLVKDSCMDNYTNEEGTFTGGFDGCVEAMQDCKGLPEENARKLCAYIGRQAGKIASLVKAKHQSHTAAPGAVVDKTKETGVDMAEDPKNEQAAPQTGAAKTQDPSVADLAAAIKTIVTRLDAMEGKTAGGDFVKSMDEVKTSLEEFGKSLTGIGERILKLEGLVGIPATQKKGKAPDATEREIDLSKATPNDLLAIMAGRK